MTISLHAVWFALILFAGACLASEAAPSFREKFDLPCDPKPVLEKILSQPEFQDHQDDSLLERLREWLGRLLDEALRWLVRRLPEGRGSKLDPDSAWKFVNVFIMTWAVAALGVAVWFVIRYVRLRYADSRTPQYAADDDVGDLLSSIEARTLATLAAEQSDYRSAVIYLFRSVLLWLDERGSLSLHDGKTNREVLEGVAPDAAFRQPLTELVPVFDRVKYGLADCKKEEYEQFLVTSRLVEEASSSGSGRVACHRVEKSS